MAKRDKAGIIVKRTPRGLQPVSAYDAEVLMGMPLDTEFDLAPRTRRSSKQNRLYWQTLTNVVRATGKWPTPEHLHSELRLVCGFRTTVVDWDTGRVVTAVDSTAFEAMKAHDFQVYFEQAMQKLSEHVGFDVLAFAEAA